MISVLNILPSIAFPGILNWQKRLWLTLSDFYAARTAVGDAALESVDTKGETFQAEDDKLFDARNFYVKGATFNYRHTHQLSVAVSKMQGLTNSLRVNYSILLIFVFTFFYFYFFILTSVPRSILSVLVHNMNAHWLVKS